MEDTHPPTITSFVIRFVLDESLPPAEKPVFRGSIRHIQSNQEVSFTHWDEATQFIQRFVPIEVQDPQVKS